MTKTCSAPCLTADDFGLDDAPDTILAAHADCPRHGNSESIGAYVNRLGVAQGLLERAVFARDEHPGSVEAEITAGSAEQLREDALTELVFAVLRSRLGLPVDASGRTVTDRLAGVARDADGWRSPTRAYQAGVGSVLAALGQSAL